MIFFHQLWTLFRKQVTVDSRHEKTSIITLLLLPSLLMFLSSTNSGASSPSTITELRECKYDSLRYCNYPIATNIPEHFVLNTTDVVGGLKTALSIVSENLGSDYETVFSDNVEFPSRVAGTLSLFNETTADIIWFSNDINTAFPNLMISGINEELERLNNPVRFRNVENPWRFEGQKGFDWRVATFFLLAQAVSSQICTDKSSNMYFYLNRVGLLPSVYWSFQYIYFMLLASISIAIMAILSVSTGRDTHVEGYFISAWFHVTFGIFLGSFLKKKSVVNVCITFLLILVFIVPVLFIWAFPQTELVLSIYRGIQTIPIYFVNGLYDEEKLRGGSIITIILMALSSYLTPLFSVSEGMYSSTRRNYLYFLSPKFWTEGIVALPSYKEGKTETYSNFESKLDEENGKQTDVLQFSNCVKEFQIITRDRKNCFKKTVDEKTIGPMNLSLQVGKISTLLGPNGVGKSTFLKVAGGYFVPSEGEIMFYDKNIFRSSWRSLKDISLCPQDNYLFDDMTVEEHMQFISTLRDTSDIKDLNFHIEWILKTLNIGDKKSTLASNLSGGMKRRLCLAMAVVGFPKVLLLDEPSSGVDSINQRGIWKLLETAKKHSAILLTSHSALEAVILSDNVITMNSSIDISSNSGFVGLGFSVKNAIDNSTKEFSVTSSSLENLHEIISSLPNDGSEWKVASKRLTGENLLPLSEYFTSREEKPHEEVAGKENGQNFEDVQTEEMQRNTGAVFNKNDSFRRQVMTLLKINFFHPDRIGFLMIMGIPIQAGFLWYATFFPSLRLSSQVFMIPLTPLIFTIAPSIILSNIIVILSQERSLGVAKLVFSQGISREAYLASFIIYYGLLSLPIPGATIISIGWVYGTFGTTLALFVLYLSFCVFHMGFSMVCGSYLNQTTAFVSVNVLPTIFGIFAQGSSSEMFANSWPGSVGQVMSSLLINDLSKFEWGLYALSIIVNVVLGSLGFFLFLTKFENYNPVSAKLCNRNRAENTVLPPKEVETIENAESLHSDMLLEGVNIDKVYGVGVKDKSSFKALDNVTFSVSGGSLLGLVGKSGAGKSTLMEVLSGQISASRGSVLVEGKKQKRAEISKVVSLCSQLDTIWPDMKVINAIKVFMNCRGYGNDSYTRNGIADPHVSNLISQLGIQDMLNKPVKKLSGGQKRRLAFLTSLIGDTRVVLVDEAMTGVDVETRQVMWKILQSEVSTRNRSVVVTTHDISEVEQYCNTVGILHRGRLIEMGLLTDIQKKWNDSIKLICLVDSHESLRTLENCLSSQKNTVVRTKNVDVLDETSANEGIGKMVATYTIDLGDLRHVANLIKTMEDHQSSSGEEHAVSFWSIEPMSLDDFIVATSNRSS